MGRVETRQVISEDEKPDVRLGVREARRGTNSPRVPHAARGWCRATQQSRPRNSVHAVGGAPPMIMVCGRAKTGIMGVTSACRGCGEAGGEAGDEGGPYERETVVTVATRR